MTQHLADGECPDCPPEKQLGVPHDHVQNCGGCGAYLEPGAYHVHHDNDAGLFGFYVGTRLVTPYERRCSALTGDLSCFKKLGHEGPHKAPSSRLRRRWADENTANEDGPVEVPDTVLCAACDSDDVPCAKHHGKRSMEWYQTARNAMDWNYHNLAPVVDALMAKADRETQDRAKWHAKRGEMLREMEGKFYRVVKERDNLKADLAESKGRQDEQAKIIREQSHEIKALRNGSKTSALYERRLREQHLSDVRLKNAVAAVLFDSTLDEFSGYHRARQIIKGRQS